MGKFDDKTKPNTEEVDKWKWVNLEELKKDIQKNPDNYSYWLKASIDKIISYSSQK
jgi:isopentenyl-diphosphate delta-isomerase